MPTIQCPKCGRKLPASDEELESGQLFECARCNTRFQAPPADDTTRSPQPVGMAKGTRLAIQVGLFVLVPALLLCWLAVGISHRAAATAAANPTTTHPRGHSQQIDEPPQENARSLENVAGPFIVLFVMVGTVVGTVGAIVSHAGHDRRCPTCGRWWAKQHVGRTMVEEEEAYGIVRRHGESSTHGSYGGSYGGYGSRGGWHSGSSSHRTHSSWEERVPVIRTTFLVHFRCRYCAFAWDKTGVEEYEDFDRG
jgi:hypothetical protein